VAAKHFLHKFHSCTASRFARRRVARHLFSLTLGVVIGLVMISSVLAQTADSERVHIVAPEETLSKLAKMYSTTVGELVRINGLESADYIWVGQRLVIGIVRPAPAVAVSGAHVVEAGENLLQIARRYGVSAESIASANGLANPNRILVGQTLQIPRGAGGAVLDGAQAKRSSESSVNRGAAADVQLGVPYRSQLTGSPYEQSDCGPATLGMILSYYGKDVSTATLRQWVMESTGYWGYDGGSDWRSLVYASNKAGFRVDALYNSSGGYQKWSIDDLTAELKAGNPVMPLVRFRALPGHESSTWWGDHYIAIIGVRSDGQFIYHDSAYSSGEAGAYRTISADGLQRAWSTTSVGIQYSAMILTR